MPNLLEIIKQSAVEAVTAANPCAVRFGQVINQSPLKIIVEQRLTLDSSHIVLTKNVSDYAVTVSMDWTTEATDHVHGITGTKAITIHNGLKVGDHVILLQMQGGQKYIVLDRVVMT